MQTITKKLSELKRPEKNVRLHSDKQIKEYIRSIEMFGQIRPIVIDENNTVLAGNGLLQALQIMGRENADCHIVPNLSPKQKKKLMLADNKIFELGTNNTEVFDELLREPGGDIDIPGYDEELLKSLTANAAQADEMIKSCDATNEENVQEMQHAQPQTPQSQQRITPSTEISTKEFADEKFNCTCPRCGLKFHV